MLTALLLLALAQSGPPPAVEDDSPALWAFPFVSNARPPYGAGDCPTGVSLLGSKGEAVTTTAAGAGRHCVRTDGGLVALAANEPAVSGAAVKVRAQVVNAIVRSEAIDDIAWSKLGAIGDGGVAASMTPVVTASDAGVEFFDPRGGNTAEKVDFAQTAWAGDRSIIYRQFATAGGVASTGIYLRVADGGTATVYVSTDALGTNQAVTSTACNLTGAWQRCKAENETAAAANTYFIFGTDLISGSGQAAQPAATVMAWGAQGQNTATLSDYCGPTTTGATTCAGERIGTPRPAVVTDVEGCASFRAGIPANATGTNYMLLMGASAPTGAIYFNGTTGAVNFYDGTAAASWTGTALAGTTAVIRAWWSSAAGKHAIVVNGVEVQANYDGAMLGDTIYLGSAAGALQFGGDISNLIVDGNRYGCQQ